MVTECDVPLPKMAIVVPYDVVAPYSTTVVPTKFVVQLMRIEVDETAVTCRSDICIALVENDLSVLEATSDELVADADLTLK
jgi:hypothetical protein